MDAKAWLDAKQIEMMSANRITGIGVTGFDE
jgi:hypothetical protein